MTKQTQVPIWQPTERQAEALASPVTDLFYGGGRGGGKTDFLLADWVACASQQPGCTGLLVRRTLPELDDVQRRALELYPRLKADYKSAPREWHFPNGSILRMRYLETVADASRYQGHQYQWIGGDEAGNWPKPDVIDLLRGCMRSARGHICYMRLTGNPGGPGHDWLKARYITPATPGEPHVDPATGIERVFIPSLLADNPHITDVDSYRKNLEGAGPPHLVKAWLHGDWDILPSGGVIDPTKINRGPRPKHLTRVYLSVDGALTEESVGRGDETAITIWGEEAEVGGGRATAQHWMLHQEAGRWSVTQGADRIMACLAEWDPMAVWIEGGPSGRALESVLKERMTMAGSTWGIELIPHTGDKIAKAAALADLINVGKVWVPEGAAWWPAFRDQATTFDGQDGRPDDRIDSAAIPPRVLRRLALNRPDPAPPMALPPRAAPNLVRRVEDLAKRDKPANGGMARRSALRR